MWEINSLIVEKLSRCHTTIGRFLQKYDQNATIFRTKGSGRKKKSTEREDQKSSDLLRKMV